MHLFATISSHEIDSGPADADEASIVDSTKSSSIARLAERSRIYRVPRSDWRRSQTGPKGRTGESSRAERRRNREILTPINAPGKGDVRNARERVVLLPDQHKVEGKYRALKYKYKGWDGGQKNRKELA